MTIQLVEGQTFAADYTLLHPLEGGSAWLALFEPTQERVRISVLDEDADQLEPLNANVQRYKPLVHPNILRTFEVAAEAGDCFVSAEYKKGLKPLDLSRPFDESWPIVKQLISAIDYAHSLGFHHAGITPERLMMDANGTPYLDGFGLPPASADSAFIAPEAASNPSPACDVFAIAQVIYKMLVGNTFAATDEQGDVPLDESLRPLLGAMMADNPAARPSDFSSLISLIEESRSQSHSPVSATSFERAATRTAPNEPAARQPHQLPRDRHSVSMPLALGGLTILLVIAFGLFFLLPEPGAQAPGATTTNDVTRAQPAVNEPQPAANEPAPKTELAPLELARLEELRKQGKALAAELLRLQVAVEDVGGRLWAGDRYDTSTALAIEGDELYRNEALQQAVDKYNEGIALLEQVLEETDDVFAKTLDQGIAALDAGDFETAIRAYRIVTRIRPNDAALAAELERALNLEQVLRLTAEAEVLARNGELQAALERFKQAASLDPLWSPATEGVASINNQIARARFQTEMSKGFTALAASEFDAAQAAFEQAQKILPNSSEPNDGLQQIALAKTQRQVRDLMQNARQLESEYQWEAAIPVYEEILTISPGLSTATAALQQAKERFELKATLTRYVNQPHLMQNDEDLAQARTALLAAARLSSDGLKSEVKALSHLVSLARLPVEVIIESDNRTDVTVFKEGNFGKIDEVQLSLVPGVYTFVGKRNGYRDVYKEVHIKGDESPVTITVRCTEKI